MGQKRTSYRDRYFSDNQAVRVAARNRKGYRTVYQYVGLWKSWESADGRLKRQKFRIGLTELAGLCLYLTCALVNAPINCSHAAAGLGLLSVVPFLLAKGFIQEQSMDEIDQSIRSGCCLRAILVIASGLAGMAGCIQAGTAGVLDALVFAGIGASGILSIVIWRLYDKLLVNTYRNVNGNPGSKI